MILPSKRFIKLFALGTIPLLWVSTTPAVIYVTVAYGVALICVTALDLIVSVKPKQLDVKRELKEKLSLGENNAIKVKVRSYGQRAVRLIIKDDYPYQFESVEEETKDGIPARIAAFGECEVKYHVRPLNRGDYQFGKIGVRLESALGLAIRQFSFDANQEVRVYPSLIGLQKYELIAKNKHLLESGFHTIRRSGVGTEFERLRDYLPDDEYRHINWKATAKLQKPITQVYETERSQNIIIGIDAGRMMSSKAGEMSKLDYAINACLMLAYVATTYDDKIGLFVFSYSVETFIPPRKGRAQFQRFIETLYGIKAELDYVDYKNVFSYIATKNKKRSLIVIFTDILDDEGAKSLLRYISVFRPLHLPLCVTMTDPGIMALRDREPANIKEAYEQGVAAELLQEREQTLNSLKRQGALVINKPPAELSIAVVNKYIELKAKSML